MEQLMPLPTDLRLFDGGAAGAAPAGAGAGQAGTQAAPASSQQGKSGGKETVIYGKPPQTPGEGSDAGSRKPEVKTTSDTMEEKRARFRQLVQGEFKDVYTQDTQAIIDRRFKETRSLQERLNAQQGILDLLSQRYNVEDGDLGKLQKALENDVSYVRQAAEDAGMTEEQYMELQRYKLENARLRAAETRAVQRYQADQQYNLWMQESRALKEQYPDFDLQTELQNPRFVGMLRAKVPIETAYQVAHLDEIKSAAAAAREKAVVDNIKANGRRPAENLSASGSGVTYKSDVTKLTAEDRKKIAAQVRAGKQIRF